MSGPSFCSLCSAAWPDTPGPHQCHERREDRPMVKRRHSPTAERERIIVALCERAGMVRHGSAALLNAARDLERGRL